PTGTISFTTTGTGLFNSTSCTLHLGTCAVTYNDVLGSLGQVPISASYSGDTNNQPSSNSAVLSVTQSTTTTTVSLNPSSVPVGGTTTVTAQVSGFLPTGTVSFTSDGLGSFNSTSCTVHNNQCVVKYTPSSVGSGSHQISASYSGDANNVASSGSSVLTVTQTTSSESISLNPTSITVG